MSTETPSNYPPPIPPNYATEGKAWDKLSANEKAAILNYNGANDSQRAEMWQKFNQLTVIVNRVGNE